MLLFPVARPSAWVLDRWLGKEGISYFREQDLHTVIRKHFESQHSDVGELEGTGAINFLKLDDISVNQLGEVVDPESVLMLPIVCGMPVFPEYKRNTNDTFLRQISHSGKKWVIIVDADNQPQVALNCRTFLRDALFAEFAPVPTHYCHRPIIVKDDSTQLGTVLTGFKIEARHEADDVIENDLILVWGTQPRVIAGTDILGRLLRDIAVRETGGHDFKVKQSSA